ncbi:MAG: Gfo/Idh/MocA family oxidoreductase [Alphaproteobacteria bacterium]|nr:Gfo/Idh/MocA family oxidoreductase [Alphaproteobacteria bacterium]MDE2112273.1 Gfo/Idh/MocA family oxidoreductase [Alphaproteobacteria bacterium]MDE2494399.1 Gfo/Idh/MocA family oxidoreductase [Alphaproteobacteria bacterium]
MQIIRVGILGAARIAPKAVIGPARDNPEFQIVAVAARDKGRAQAFAAETDIPLVADGYSALITCEDVDLVYVALPHAAHREWSLAALKAGKAVLCEKPFAMNAAEAQGMTTTAEDAKLPLIEAFHNRFHRVMRRAAEIVASGELGKLIEAEAIFDVEILYTPTELRWIPAQGGGALMDLGCYCVHALRTIAAREPVVTSARCTIVRGVDETTVAELQFPNGLRAKIHTSMKSPAFKAPLRITGEKGTLEISNYVSPQEGCRFTVETEGKRREEPANGPSTYATQLAHVGDVMLRDAKPLTGGADAIANMACIDAIYAAAGYTRPTNK